MSLSKITMLIDGQEELTTTQKEKRVGIVNVKDAVVQKILVRHRNLALAYNGFAVLPLTWLFNDFSGVQSKPVLNLIYLRYEKMV